MASAWGISWGRSWGNSWGAIRTSRGDDAPGMRYTAGEAKKHFRQLFDDKVYSSVANALEAIRDAEKAPKIQVARKIKVAEKRIETALGAIPEPIEHELPTFTGTDYIAQLEALKGIKAELIAVMREREEYIRRRRKRQNDDAIALLMGSI